jgi:hypothetical protein
MIACVQVPSRRNLPIVPIDEIPFFLLNAIHVLPGWPWQAADYCDIIAALGDSRHAPLVLLPVLGRSLKGC